MSIVAIAAFMAIIAAVWLGRPDTTNTQDPGQRIKAATPQSPEQQAPNTQTPSASPGADRQDTGQDTGSNPAAPVETPETNAAGSAATTEATPQPVEPNAIEQPAAPYADTVEPDPNWVCTIWSDDNVDATSGNGRTCLQWTHR